MTDGRQDWAELSEGLLTLLSESETFIDALGDVLRVVCTTTSWAYGEAWVPDDTTGRLSRRAHWTDPDVDAFADTSEDALFRRGEGLPGRAWASGDPEWISDLQRSDREFVRLQAAMAAGLHTAVSVPLAANGRVLAVLVFLAPERRSIDYELLELVQSLASQLAAVLLRERLDADIEDEHSLLESILAVSPVGIVVTDREDGIELINEEAAHVLGHTTGDIVEVGYDDPDWVIADADGEPVPEDEQPARRVFRTGQPVLNERYRFEHIDGSLVVCSLNAAPIVDGDGTVRKVVITFTDMTDQQAYERGLERKNAELESFASVLSHDLRNPLSVAKGYVELARETGQVEYLDPVERAHERMDALISDLLLLARRGRAIGEKTTVDVAAAARDAWLTTDAPDTATLVVADGLGTVEADRGRFLQLFENLFRNAVRHAGPDVTVRVRPLSDGVSEGAPNRTGLSVEDDGPGIPADRRESVLELAKREDGVRLGLSIVRAIAEAHEWTLHIADAEATPSGARFVLRFDVPPADPLDG